MNKFQATLVGGIVGGAIGWVIGSIIADQLFPEYYTEEELEYMRYQALYSPEESEEPDTTAVKLQEFDDSHDYTKHYIVTNEVNVKPSLMDYAESRAAFRNSINNSGKVEEEEGMEEYDYEDADSEYEYEDDIPEEEIPYIDMDYLTEYDDSYYIQHRDEEGPFIITEQEWTENELGLRKTKLLYFSHDDVLTDEKNLPLHSIDKTVGPHALLNFGAFASSDDVVYVQNDARKVLYQIRQLDDGYEHKVLGGKALVPPKEETRVVKRIFDEYDDTLPPDAPRGPK